MNHVSASDDTTLMSFPLSTCILIVFILAALLNSAAPRLVKINMCLQLWVCTAVCAYERHEWIDPDRRYHTAPCQATLHIT